MVLQQEFIDFWGVDNLHRILPNSHLGSHIPEASRIFLAEVGLPRELQAAYEVLGVRFIVKAGFPQSLAESQTDIQGLTFDEQQRFWIIGSIDDSPLCIDERNGDIVSVFPEDGLTVRINSSLEQLVTFILLFEKTSLANNDITNDDIESVTEEKIQNNIVEMEKQFRNVDPLALKNDDDWWSIILDQMKRSER